MKASIFRVCPFTIIQWGLPYLLGESAPAPEVAGWTTVNVHVVKLLLEIHPIKFVLSGGLLILFSLQLLHLRLYRSVAFLQGVPLHKATRRVLTVLSEPVELTPFSGCLSPPAAFSVQWLSFNQEAFQVFRPED
jgi:hypothetical protein